jgi:IS30 family transposase
MLMRDDHCSMRAIAKRLCRSASTISRELKRADASGVYDGNRAQGLALAQRVKSRKVPKLHVHSMLFIVVRHLLNLR